MKLALFAFLASAVTAQTTEPNCILLRCQKPAEGCRWKVTKLENGCFDGCGVEVCDCPVDSCEEPADGCHYETIIDDRGCEHTCGLLVCPTEAPTEAPCPVDSCVPAPEGCTYETTIDDRGCEHTCGLLICPTITPCPVDSCEEPERGCHYETTIDDRGCELHCDLLVCTEAPCPVYSCVEPDEGCHYETTIDDRGCENTCGLLVCPTEAPCPVDSCVEPDEGCHYETTIDDRGCEHTCGRLVCHEVCAADSCPDVTIPHDVKPKKFTFKRSCFLSSEPAPTCTPFTYGQIKLKSESKVAIVSSNCEGDCDADPNCSAWSQKGNKCNLFSDLTKLTYVWGRNKWTSGIKTVAAVTGTTTCSTNEVYKECSSMCEPECGVEESFCIEMCGPPKCQCARGHKRNTDNTCVLEAACDN